MLTLTPKPKLRKLLQKVKKKGSSYKTSTVESEVPSTDSDIF